MGKFAPLCVNELHCVISHGDLMSPLVIIMHFQISIRLTKVLQLHPYRNFAALMETQQSRMVALRLTSIHSQTRTAMQIDRFILRLPRLRTTSLVLSNTESGHDRGITGGIRPVHSTDAAHDITYDPPPKPHRSPAFTYTLSTISTFQSMNAWIGRCYADVDSGEPKHDRVMILAWLCVGVLRRKGIISQM